MATVVMANAEFVLWANDALNYRDVKKTIETLQKADKVEIGKLFIAYRDKKTCPTELANKVSTFMPTCKVCRALLTRSDIFNCHLSGLSETYCESHRPASISIEVQEYKKTNNEFPKCANCGVTNVCSNNNVSWVDTDKLPHYSPESKLVCNKCYDYFYRTKPYVKPAVIFMSDDI